VSQSHQFEKLPLGSASANMVAKKRIEKEKKKGGMIEDRMPIKGY
jgi:hypothetical protein